MRHMRGLLIFPLTGAIGIAAYWAYMPSSQIYGPTISHGPQTERAVALTFDDGPSDPWTLRTADVLERYGVKGTFFVVGQNADAHPDVVRAHGIPSYRPGEATIYMMRHRGAEAHRCVGMAFPSPKPVKYNETAKLPTKGNPMLPTVCIVGRSNSGKTTTMERLVRELKARNYRVASVKRSSHPFEIDYKGKDSWRLFQAGSDAVVLTSSQLGVQILRQERYPSLEEIALSLGDGYDILLVEGYKESSAPKIEVFNPQVSESLICPVEQLVGVITPHRLDLPLWQCGPDDIPALADFVEERFLSQPDETPDVSLLVNDAPVRLNAFAKKIISGMVFAFVSALSGVTFPRKISITFKIGG